MSVRVRFAPSPTGRIHIGNARTALLNWLFAKSQGGRFLLRFDDTDKARSTPAFAQAIKDDLAWLGIVPNEIVRQSDRLARYRREAARLKEAGRLYACYETPDQLERKREQLRARGLPPIYDRAGLALTAQDHAQLERRGLRPHWRFLLDRRQASWNDLIRGRQDVDAAPLSDPVLIRADGTVLYTLSSVIDDIDFSIGTVIRGEDHVTNTAIQLQLFKALAAPPPLFAHHSLMVDKDGRGLSKRSGALSLCDYRERGFEPMAVASLAATLGMSQATNVHDSMSELMAGFDITRLSRAPVYFNEKELEAFNARLLQRLPYESVAERLIAMGVGGNAAFWKAVRANCRKLKDARGWWAIVTGPIGPAIDEADYCACAGEELPAEPWNGTTWKDWTGRIKARTGRKGKALFMPLRRALTGLDHGPELAVLLPLIGRDKAMRRLNGKTT